MFKKVLPVILGCSLLVSSAHAHWTDSLVTGLLMGGFAARQLFVSDAAYYPNAPFSTNQKIMLPLLLSLGGFSVSSLLQNMFTK